VVPGRILLYSASVGHRPVRPMIARLDSGMALISAGGVGEPGRTNVSAVVGGFLLQRIRSRQTSVIAESLRGKSAGRTRWAAAALEGLGG